MTPETREFIQALAYLIGTFMGVITAAVAIWKLTSVGRWVGKMEGSVEHLVDAIRSGFQRNEAYHEKLEKKLEEQDERISNHGERIARIEE